jgi:hypothetical protein
METIGLRALRRARLLDALLTTLMSSRMSRRRRNSSKAASTGGLSRYYVDSVNTSAFLRFKVMCVTQQRWVFFFCDRMTDLLAPAVFASHNQQTSLYLTRSMCFVVLSV